MVLFCGACTDYGSQLDDLEKQIEALEQELNDCSSLVSNVESLISKVKEGNGVSSIVPIQDGEEILGYIVTFSDGGNVTLYNQPSYITVGEYSGNYYWKVDGEWLTDADGEKVCIAQKENPAPIFKVENNQLKYSVDNGVTYLVAGDLNKQVISALTQDNDNYYFELTEGGRITLPKAGLFCLELLDDEVEISDGGTVTAKYKVTGGGSKLEVSTMAGKGWKADVAKTSDSEGTITVTAPSPVTTDKVLVVASDGTGKMVVRALRLTVKSSLKRGSIDTYVYHGVRYRHINPATIDPAVALQRYQAVPDAGVQIMSCDGGNVWNNEDYYNEVVTQLDLAQQVGLKLAVCVDCYLGTDDYPDGHPEQMRRMVNLVKDHPALWGYQLIDEPNADYFSTIYAGQAVIKEIDAEHPCYANLHGDGGTFGPNGSYHTANYTEYLERCVNEMHPDFITFDVYPCISNKVIDYPWYTSLEQVAATAKKYGLKFWAFAATCRFQDGNGWQAKPSMATLRLQDYTNLAYGAQGLEYFTWAATSGQFGCWVCDTEGNINTENPTFEYLQAINIEVQNRAFVFDGCQVQWTAHYNNVPVGCSAVDLTKVPDEVASIQTKDNFLFSLIENDDAESEYLCIVSRTHLKSSSIHLRFRYPVQTVERDGSLTTYNPGDYDFAVEPGDIIIIKTR